MPSAPKDDTPAFPTDASRLGDGKWRGQPGMMLRDWFAGQALTGQITFEGMEGCDAPFIAGCAYELADAMLVERAKAVRS